MTYNFKDLVWIDRLGDGTPGRFAGKVVGKGESYPQVEFYIVEMFDKLPGQGKWTHVTFPSSCMSHMTEDEWMA